jgi:hypothetical protein
MLVLFALLCFAKQQAGLHIADTSRTLVGLLSRSCSALVVDHKLSYNATFGTALAMIDSTNDRGMTSMCVEGAYGRRVRDLSVGLGAHAKMERRSTDGLGRG